MRSSRPATCALRWAAALALALLTAGQVEAQTAVRTVQPTALTIEAGGARGEFVVQGTGLDKVRSIEVMLLRRGFSGVSGHIARARASELVLSVGAEAGVGSTSDLRVVLVTSSQRIEIPATLDVVAPPPPPATTAPPPEPIVLSAGAFVVTVALPAGVGEPPDPVTHAAGVFLVSVAPPAVDSTPPQPVTATVGTFVVTIAPPASGSH